MKYRRFKEHWLDTKSCDEDDQAWWELMMYGRSPAWWGVMKYDKVRRGMMRGYEVWCWMMRYYDITNEESWGAIGFWRVWYRKGYLRQYGYNDEAWLARMRRDKVWWCMTHKACQFSLDWMSFGHVCWGTVSYRYNHVIRHDGVLLGMMSNDKRLLYIGYNTLSSGRMKKCRKIWYITWHLMR